MSEESMKRIRREMSTQLGQALKPQDGMLFLADNTLLAGFPRPQPDQIGGR
ncbi:MAG: hypothetical protein QM527_01830 [Alphaproteobacteria bacterium]|nr:hypothetical protein [Alphaproteobacteria bacterium]